MEEQYAILARALLTKATADPLLDSWEVVRDYDWIDYYADLPSDIEDALNHGMKYPQSVKDVSNTVKADILYERQQEALELKKIREDFLGNLAWHLDITDEYGEFVAGDIRPGGWFNNQSSNWRVYVVSDLVSIGRDDLLNIKFAFEVA